MSFTGPSCRMGVAGCAMLACDVSGTGRQAGHAVKTDATAPDARRRDAGRAIMKPWIAAAVVLVLGGPLSAQAPTVTSPHQATDEEKSRTSESVFPAWMAGRWAASPFDIELNSELHRSVYGVGAHSVRLVDL